MEVGDGTTSVVILAAELLSRSHDLVLQGVHPTNVMSGLRMAMRESVKYVSENLCLKTTEMSKEIFIGVAKTAMSSKILSSEAELFSKICVDAIENVKTINSEKKAKYPVKAINIVKCHGQSSHESKLING